MILSSLINATTYIVYILILLFSLTNANLIQSKKYSFSRDPL